MLNKNTYIIVLSLFVSMQISWAQDTACDFKLNNPDFELPDITATFGSNTYKVFNATQSGGWKTTAADNKVEYWKSGYQGVPAYSGNQFAELNANLVAALFQDASTIPGTTLKYGFAHRGRNGVDSMELLIGPPGGPYVSQGKYGTGKNAWVFYTGNYLVPAGQTTTRLQFLSVSAAGGSKSVGNFLDAIDIQSVNISMSASASPTCNGTINVHTSAPATVTREFSLDNVTYKNDSSFSGLAPGTYTVYVRLGGICTQQQTITLIPPTNPGTLTGGNPICYGVGSDNLTLAGYTGSIIGWESSTNNFASATPIANTTATQPYSNLNSSTKYRVIVKSGTCPVDTSNIIEIKTISPRAFVSPVLSTCLGDKTNNDAALYLSPLTFPDTHAFRYDYSAGNSYTGSQTYANATSIGNDTTTGKLNNPAVSQNYTVRFYSVEGCFYDTTIALKNSSCFCSQAQSSTTVFPADSAFSTGYKSNAGFDLRWTVSDPLYKGAVVQAPSDLPSPNAASVKYSPAKIQNKCAGAWVDPQLLPAPFDQAHWITGTPALCFSEQEKYIYRYYRNTFELPCNCNQLANYGSNQIQINLDAYGDNQIIALYVNGEEISAPYLPSSTTTFIAGKQAKLTFNGKWHAGSNSIEILMVNGTAGTVKAAVEGLLVTGNQAIPNKYKTKPDAGADVTQCILMDSIDLKNATGMQIWTLLSSPKSVTIDDSTGLSKGLTLAGNYKYILMADSTDFSGCQDTLTANIFDVPASIVSTDSTVCTGVNSGTLHLSNYLGNILRWESSTNNFINDADIISNSASYTYSNLTQNTKYRAIVKANNCIETQSSVATISVDSKSVGGTVTSDTTVCSGSNDGSLKLAGHTGTIMSWEKSVNNNTTNISNTSATQLYSNLTSTTSYLATVKSGVCPSVKSAAATITVDAPSVAGSLSGGATVCIGANSGSIKLSGQTGTIVGWEKSTDDFVNDTTKISNTTNTQAYSNISKNTKYRAIVKSGVCPAAYTPLETIAISPLSNAGTLNGANAVCEGSNSGTIVLSGYVGAIKGWEKAKKNSNDFHAIPGTANAYSYTFHNIAESTKFRVNVQSGTCAPAKSLDAAVAVNPLSKGGNPTADTTVCIDGNSGSITLTGYTGTIQGWESSTDDFKNAIPNATTTPTINFSNLSASTKYRAIIKSGACPATTSPIASIAVDPLSVGGKVNSDTTVCSSNNAGSLFLSGYNGSIVQWMSSTNNFNTSDIINNTSAQQNFNNLSSTTYYKAVVKSGVCPSVEANFATVTVDPKTIGGEVSSNATICMEANNGTLTLSNSLGTILNWESSSNNIKNTIANNLSTQNYTNLSESTTYRALVKSGVCPAEYSASASLSIDPIYLLNLGPDSTICFSTGHQWSTTLPDTFASILWSTGATDTAITVKHAGILTLNVSTKYGCKAQDEVVFEEYCVPNEICFPDVITPNNDGINDVFMPCFDNFIKITDDNYKGVVDHIEFISFEIFNRWGVLLFASENTLPQWDGDKGSSSSPDGTYYWIVNYRDQIKHENHQQTGYLTVMGKN